MRPRNRHASPYAGILASEEARSEKGGLTVNPVTIARVQAGQRSGDVLVLRICCAGSPAAA